MDDLISRQAAIDFIDAGRVVNPNEARWSDNEVVNFLKSRPSAQSEIIRCKGCRHYMRPHGCGHIDGMVTAQEDGFCSYAERRGE